jgi:thiol-disulfide isomerase/thioredoxin
VRRRLSGLAVLVLLLTGCGGDTGSSMAPPPGEAKVDVDTPELRALKREAGVEDCRPGTGDPVEGGLPEVTLPCLGGGSDVDLSGLRGPLVVNLWASWCGPCRKEMPVLQDFHERYGDRVAVLGIDHNDPQTTNALELVRDTGVTYPLLADPQTALSGTEPFPVLRGLPFLALVDEEGVVVHREFVVLESTDQLADLVEEHLGVAL